jgi:hypothetical protein
VARANREAWQAGYKGNEHFEDWVKRHRLDDRSSAQINQLRGSWNDGMDAEIEKQRGRASKQVSRAAPVVDKGVAAEVASALVNYGASAGDAREAAREAAKSGGDFDVVFKRALSMVSKRNPKIGGLGTGHWEEFDSEKAAKQYGRLMEGRGEKVLVWRNKVRVEDREENPAKSAQQYRLAQAVLSGTARGSHMPVDVAREIVERTPAKLRSEWSKANPGLEVRDMKLDSEGYDKHGKYWGAGQKVYYYVDDNDNSGYVRASSAADAKRKAAAELSRKGNPGESVYSVGTEQIPYAAHGLTQTQAVQLLKKYPMDNLGLWNYIWKKQPDGSYKKINVRGKRNPEDTAADMYEAFHGAPSEQLVTYHDEEHYHEYLSELGVCCGLLVECGDGGVQAIGLSGYEWSGKGKDAGFVEGRENPRKRKKGPIGQSAELLGSWAEEGDSALGRVLGGNPYNSDLGQQAFEAGKHWVSIAHESGVANARVVRYGFLKWWNSLSPATTKGQKQSSMERDFRQGYAAGKRRSNPDDHPDPISPSTTLLCSNEDGTQLYLQGGDQSLDLDALGIEGDAATKELIVIGEAVKIYYETAKDFDKYETIQYHHDLGEISGEVPILAYDRMNERLLIVGGAYHIEKPLMETSAGIEN